MDFKEKQNFFSNIINFKESENKGVFDGELVVYNTKNLANGAFRFEKDSMKVNDGKKLFMLYQHNDYSIPMGVMTGKSDGHGFKVRAEFDLSVMDNGNPINPEATKIYSLMKNQKADFQLSVGGYINSYEMKMEEQKEFVLIKEFVAHEGSVVLRGAVDGAVINNVFNNNGAAKTGGKTDMEDKILETLTAKLEGIEKFMNNANDEKSINELKTKFESFKTEYDGSATELKKEIQDKFEKMNNIILTLKEGYAKENDKEFGEIEQIYSIFSEANQWATGSKKEIMGEEEFALSDTTKKSLKFSATTAMVDAIKPTYITKILERLQAANPILSQIDFMPITDGSLKVTREELALPTTGIIGESATRVETTATTLDSIAVELFQFYVMPIVSNKLLATNYVGYLPFLLKRTEYALALNIANKVFSGTGVSQPLGILNDTTITNKAVIDLSTDGDELVDANFAKKIKNIYYSVRSEIAEKAVWVMRRSTWAYITNLQNSDKTFYTNDFTGVEKRALMNRPVLIVEDDESGITDINKTTGKPIIVFGDFKNGMQGIQNNSMTIGIEDRITTKGFTKYWMEKGLGFKTKLPENFVIVTNKLDA